MNIVGFPVDLSRSQDSRVLKDLKTRQTLVQVTLDLIQAGDVEPGSVAIATIARVSPKLLRRYFPTLNGLYCAAIERALEGVTDRDRVVDSAAPLSHRIRQLVADRAQMFEQWSPIWQFADRMRRHAPEVALRVQALRRSLRDRLVLYFATELAGFDPVARDRAIEALDNAIGLDGWMTLRHRQRLSPGNASRTWRFNAEESAFQTLGATA